MIFPKSFYTAVELVKNGGSNVRLLDGEMFNDGSFESFNFWISDQDGTYQVSASCELIQHVRDRIEDAMRQGQRHRDTRRMELVYGGVQVLEIQWG